MKAYLPSYARTATRKQITRANKLAILAWWLALAGLLCLNASQHVYSTPDSLGIAYDNTGGIDVTRTATPWGGVDHVPAPFVCNNGPLAEVLPWFAVDC